MIMPDRPTDGWLRERLQKTGRILDPFTLARAGKPLKADVVVVGTGAGGSAAFRELARAGVDVLALEAGAYHLPQVEFNQREDRMLSRLFWSMGARTDPGMNLTMTHGRGVGGSTVHNICLSEDTPPAILRRWADEAGIVGWDEATLAPVFERVRRNIRVSAIDEGQVNLNNAVVRRGAEALGWSGRLYDHNRVACLQCGYCVLGCAYNRKQSALITYVPDGIAAGGRLAWGCEVRRIRHDAKRATGLEVALVDPHSGRSLGSLTVTAGEVVVAGSSVMTPALLDASGIRDTGGHAGKRLRVHPAVVVAGRFDEQIDGWTGLPQSYVVNEFADFYKDGHGGFLIIPLFGHPGTAAAMMPGWGPTLGRWMKQYRHVSASTPLVHDETAGRVRMDGDRVRLDYELNAGDRQTLIDGIKRTAELYFAAGAREVLLPFRRREVVIRKPAEIDIVDSIGVGPAEVLLSSVHPQCAVPMGADPDRGACDSAGRLFGWQGLRIADGSLFPSSVGVPPQLSIYAAGTMVARGLLRDLGGGA